MQNRASKLEDVYRMFAAKENAKGYQNESRERTPSPLDGICSKKSSITFKGTPPGYIH